MEKHLLLVTLPLTRSEKHTLHMEPQSRISIAMNICGDIVVARGLEDAARGHTITIAEEYIDAVLSSIEIVD